MLFITLCLIHYFSIHKRDLFGELSCFLCIHIAAYGSKGVDTWNLKSWQKEISDNDVLVLDVAVNGGTKVSDKEFVVTTELLMRKLLKVDGIKAEGDARLQRKAEIVHSIALFRVDFAGRGELTERQIIPTTSTNNTRLSQGRQLI